MLAMIDNYDSFTYNLVQYLGELGQEVEVYRNDQISVEALAAKSPDYLVVSPGPCDPARAGISIAAIQHFSGRIPVLGVCLGHQSIGEAFGGKTIHAEQLMHGKTSTIEHKQSDLFAGLPKQFTATRYHSLVVDQANLPACLEKTAWLEDGTMMALAHKSHPTRGVQFHPESISTEHGHQILKNFLALQ